MFDPFTYHPGDRTVRVTAKEEARLTTEQARVVALVKIGDEMAAIREVLSHIAQHGLSTGGAKS